MTEKETQNHIYQLARLTEISEANQARTETLQRDIKRLDAALDQLRALINNL